MSKEIYDVVTRTVISGRNLDVAEQLSTDPSNICHLRRGKFKMFVHRYCLLEKKDELIFTMVDIASKEEFECLSNASIFLHIGRPYSDNEAKYVFELRRGRQVTSAIAGRIFCLKGNEHKVEIRYISRRKDAHLNFEGVSAYRESVKKQEMIRSLLRRRILKEIQKAQKKKLHGTLELTGCTIEFLISYLESLFLPGMTWGNRGKERGKWHIDHIKPCNTFDLSKEDEQRRCFHYSNLRPLWAEDNLSRPKDGSDVFGFGLGI